MTLYSISATYPGFQALPKGIRQMLLVSESAFFDEAKPAHKEPNGHQQYEIVHGTVQIKSTSATSATSAPGATARLAEPVSR